MASESELQRQLHGTFYQEEGSDYLLSWVWGRTRRIVESLAPRLGLLRRAVQWHDEALSAIRPNEGIRLSEFERIVIENHRDVAHGLYSAQILIRCGSLADTLTLLRPAVENMLDLQYLKRWPESMHSYYEKIDEFGEKLAKDPNPSQSRDPRLVLRFMGIGPVRHRIEEQPDCSASEHAMIDQWYLLSNVAEHASPDRKALNRGTRQDWDNALGQFHNTLMLACEQLFTIDDGLHGKIEANGELVDKYRQITQELNQFHEDSNPEGNGRT